MFWVRHRCIRRNAVALFVFFFSILKGKQLKFSILVKFSQLSFSPLQTLSWVRETRSKYFWPVNLWDPRPQKSTKPIYVHLRWPRVFDPWQLKLNISNKNTPCTCIYLAIFLGVINIYKHLKLPNRITLHTTL